MGVCEIKGLRVGEGRPKVIVSLMDTSVPELSDTYERALREGADLLEWRADFWPDIHDAAKVAFVCRLISEECAREAPFIFTCRTKGQGGQVEMGCDAYEQLLGAVLGTGKPDLVDIELGIGDEAVRRMIGCAHERGIVAVVSHHDFEKTPSVEDMTAILTRMVVLGADIPKLAVMAQSAQDAEDLMRATSLVRERTGMPLVTMAMGALGQRTRLEGELFGSAMTFCALGRASAPGQVEIAQALAEMDAIHRAHASV